MLPAQSIWKRELAECLEIDGFAIVPGVFDEHELACMRDMLSSGGATEHSAKSVKRRRANTYAIREPAELFPVVAGLAQDSRILDLLRPVLGQTPRLVRSLFFDKSRSANWSVAWHQDRFIAVREKHELPGYRSWSCKAGIVHVEPPREVLEQMLTARIHLDPCDESTGALRVIAGSHKRGILLQDLVDDMIDREPSTSCAGNAGDVFLMRPLLVHSSRSTKELTHRRILHFEYAGVDLPAPLAWRYGKHAIGGSH